MSRHQDHARIVDTAIRTIDLFIQAPHLHALLERDTGLSFGSLRAIFWEQTGMSICEYVAAARMDCAKKLLAETEMKCQEVALEVGIRDFSHFVRWFKHLEGITPAEYRRSAKSGHQRGESASLYNILHGSVTDGNQNWPS